jgi:hypothetical protein
MFRISMKPASVQWLYNVMAEGVGFEPTESFHPRWFSRPVP